MKKILKRSFPTACLLCLILSMQVSQPEGVWGAIGRGSSGAASEGMARSAEISKILEALGNKVDDPKAIETARKKLFLMDTGELRLLSALSDRLVGDDAIVGSSIALLLITALLALS
jgi:hypothetical protein